MVCGVCLDLFLHHCRSRTSIKIDRVLRCSSKRSVRPRVRGTVQAYLTKRCRGERIFKEKKQYSGAAAGVGCIQLHNDLDDLGNGESPTVGELQGMESPKCG